MILHLDEEHRGLVTGWVCPDDHASPMALRVLIDGQEAGRIRADEDRWDVKAAGLHETGRCGFTLTDGVFTTFPEARSVALVSDPGGVLVWSRRQGEPVAEHKLFFVHIPKTAGTSLNSAISARFSLAREHLEVVPEETLVCMIRLRWPRSQFLSGHILANRYDWALADSEHLKVSVLREPRDQIASHIAWLRRLSDPGQEMLLGQHDEAIRAASRRLHAVDLADEGALAAWVAGFDATERTLFNNCQTRYLSCTSADEEVTPEHLPAAVATVESLDLVGITERLPRFLRLLSRLLGVPFGTPPRERVNPAADAVRAAIRGSRVIEPLIALDHDLYGAAKLRSVGLKR